MNVVIAIVGLLLMVIFLGVFPTLLLLAGDCLIMASLLMGVPVWIGLIMAFWLYLIVLDIRRNKLSQQEPGNE